MSCRQCIFVKRPVVCTLPQESFHLVKETISDDGCCTTCKHGMGDHARESAGPSTTAVDPGRSTDSSPVGGNPGFWGMIRYVFYGILLYIYRRLGLPRIVGVLREIVLLLKNSFFMGFLAVMGTLGVYIQIWLAIRIEQGHWPRKS